MKPAAPEPPGRNEGILPASPGRGIPGDLIPPAKKNGTGGIARAVLLQFPTHDFAPHAAIDTVPPCTFVDTGVQAGPLCLRGLNQNAVNHTVAPAAVVFGNTT